ncbi:hypothetical protein [Bradyrhizobium sp. SZCCHNS3052]|uniref:hypothetical protein n=1 Tax=Bradyrhizobium sp. SZCCHNS3052 TaxID=3057321 RepID=UPI002915CD75|nr:hypothetical protein [Bradyrhizobium sp. SZCCHNS3052]
MANFDASRLKIVRSRTHVGSPVEVIRAFLLRTPLYIVVELDNGRKYWCVRVREPMPAEFSAIQGDAIHNLRASLDLLACELVRLNNQSDDDVYFPFSKTQSDFQQMFTRRHMDRASQRAQALVHALQPYPGGDDDLRAVHDLDIIDKHQMLIPAADMVGMPDYAGPSGLVQGQKVSLRDGARVPVDSYLEPYVSTSRPYHGTFSLNLPLTTANGTPFPLAGREVVPTIIQLSTKVENIISQFAALYP